MNALFRDRRDAGRALARKLNHLAGRRDIVVLALPRGGVPVAYEVAEALRVPLDIFLVRKLGLPGHEEFAMGAIASGGVLILDDEVVDSFGITPAMIERVAREEQRELERRERAYRQDRPPLPLAGRVVLLVDDGLATGSSMRAAVEAVRRQGPRRIVAAVPVGAPASCAAFEELVDEVICAETPELFRGVGQWYEDFSPTGDDEVVDLLQQARESAPAIAR